MHRVAPLQRIDDRPDRIQELGCPSRRLELAQRLPRLRVERHHHRVRRELGDHRQAGSWNSVGVRLQRTERLVFDGRAKGPERTVLADVAESRRTVQLHRKQGCPEIAADDLDDQLLSVVDVDLESGEAAEPAEAFHR